MCENQTDIEYMKEAIALANEAAARDEVPVGALIVHKGQVIARSSRSSGARGGNGSRPKLSPLGRRALPTAFQLGKA